MTPSREVWSPRCRVRARRRPLTLAGEGPFTVVAVPSGPAAEGRHQAWDCRISRMS